MGQVPIKRIIDNIGSGTNVYSPLIEIVVNAIQAIESRGNQDGQVRIIVKRSFQEDLTEGLSTVKSFVVKDNGIGFTETNRQAFDTLYNDNKIAQGGKGFGRFTCLKYFDDLHVESIFEGEDGIQKRSFNMGKQTEFILDEKVEACPEGELGTQVTLRGLKGRSFPDKQVKTIARNLVERILPYFIDNDSRVPTVTISEDDGSEKITLNDFFNNQLSEFIQEIQLNDRILEFGQAETKRTFTVHVFKIYSPRTGQSKISLVAGRREVTETAIHNYVPEFIDELFDQGDDSNEKPNRNYVVKAYVFGDYLNQCVSLERGKFDFSTSEDLIDPISQSSIERAVALIARESLGSIITSRQEKKRRHVQDYVAKSAPWHSTIVGEIDLQMMPYNASPEQIEEFFQKEKFKEEVEIRRKMDEILSRTSAGDMPDGIPAIIEKISKTSRNDLIHYIALRKHVLSIFSKSIELGDDNRYPDEGTLHDIIFPRRKDSKSLAFEDHNLWIIDERLNFTEYVGSDKPLDSGTADRPDLIVFDNPVLFRGDNSLSNPVSIFEFKRPGRDSFVNLSSRDDPIDQIIRYANRIRDGECKTVGGRPIQVTENTPFYGYVMCEITEKVKKWLEKRNDFTPMPDSLGWFRWYGNLRLYFEVLSWDKVLKDAEIRNKMFFHKLGID